MIKWLIYWVINCASLMSLPYFFKGVTINGWHNALIGAVILGLLNTLVKPIVSILTLPLQILTLGLFIWVINGAFMLLAGSVIQGFQVDTFKTAILASMVYSLISWAAASILLPS